MNLKNNKCVHFLCVVRTFFLLRNRVLLLLAAFRPRLTSNHALFLLIIITNYGAIVEDLQISNIINGLSKIPSLPIVKNLEV